MFEPHTFSFSFFFLRSLSDCFGIGDRVSPLKEGRDDARKSHFLAGLDPLPESRVPQRPLPREPPSLSGAQHHPRRAQTPETTPHLIHTCNTISRTLPDYPVVLPPRTEKHPLPIRTPGRRGPQCSDSGTDPDTLGHARGRCSLHLVPTDRTNGRSQTLVSVFRVNRAQIAWRGRRRETAKKKKKGLFPLSLPFFFRPLRPTPIRAAPAPRSRPGSLVTLYYTGGQRASRGCASGSRVPAFRRKYYERRARTPPSHRATSPRHRRIAVSQS